MISIEDYLEDIVGKAMRGKGLSLDKLSDLSNVSKDSIKELLEGECNESVISSIAPHLDLDTASLIRAGKKSWRPEAVILEGVSIYNTPWNDMYVNSFLVWDPSSGSAGSRRSTIVSPILTSRGDRIFPVRYPVSPGPKRSRT